MRPDQSSSTTMGKERINTRGERAARLLDAMHLVFSHDLPNQLVIAQSLIGLLDMEEKDRLGPDGQEYLQRLGKVLERAGGMVYFLRDMARIARLEENPEDLRLSTVARDFTIQARQLFPHRTWQLEMHDQFPWVKAGRRSLHHALTALVRCGLGQIPAADLALILRSQPGQPQGALVHLRLEPQQLAKAALADRPEVGPLDQRLDWLLAQELAATWGGEIHLAPEGGFHASLTFPLPTSHG